MPKDFLTGGAVLPKDFPIVPLGSSNAKYYFLTARGEFRELAATALEKRVNLVALFSGCGPRSPDEWLVEIGPPKRQRAGDEQVFNPGAAADYLMAACDALSLFDPETSMRSLGTWEGEGGMPVAHCGETLVHPFGETERSGLMIGSAIYPAVPARGEPADEPVDAETMLLLSEQLSSMWAWQRPTDAAAWLGWIGQAALGAFPDWRAHLWVSGIGGSGKSELVEVANDLLGPMSPQVQTNFSEAGVRQSANNQARAFLFDEAENEGGDSNVGKVVEMLRHMSGGAGARVVRGSSDHKAVHFALAGAGYLGSIIPHQLAPQDRTRFVMIHLDLLVRDPDTVAELRRLADFRSQAKELGPKIWRRMLVQAVRWAKTLEIYKTLIQTMGGSSRNAATIGSILTGWDLLLFDEMPDDARLEYAKEIAAPLVKDALEAQEEGEGERCLRTLLAYFTPKESGGMIPIAELIGQNPGPTGWRDVDQLLLGRVGCRLGVFEGRRVLFVINGAHPQLDRAMMGSRWQGGAHKAAMQMIPGVRPSPNSIRIAGTKTRAMMIPDDYLPGGGSQ